jgi:hypothetical protein
VMCQLELSEPEIRALRKDLSLVIERLSVSD